LFTSQTATGGHGAMRFLRQGGGALAALWCAMERFTGWGASCVDIKGATSAGSIATILRKERGSNFQTLHILGTTSRRLFWATRSTQQGAAAPPRRRDAYSMMLFQ